MTPRDILQRCPLCHAAYTETAVVCLDPNVSTGGKPRYYHCSCSKCKRSMIALLVESTGWLSSVGMLTELTAQEAQGVPDLAPISGDHCVALHEALAKDSGYFCKKLLKQA